jgi:hypothetical protein
LPDESAIPKMPGGAILIASYSKSGNTASLCEAIASRAAALYRLSSTATSRYRTRSKRKGRACMRPALSANTATFMKSRDCWTHLPDGMLLLGGAARAALYLVRDPRDIAVSFAFHQTTSFDCTIDLHNRSFGFPEPSHLYVREQIDATGAGTFGAGSVKTDLPAHPIRQEDLQAGNEPPFRRSGAAGAGKGLCGTIGEAGDILPPGPCRR